MNCAPTYVNNLLQPRINWRCFTGTVGIRLEESRDGFHNCLLDIPQRFLAHPADSDRLPYHFFVFRIDEVNV